MSVTRAGILKLKGDLMLMQEMSPGIKPNFSKLERETGISRQTIAKIWNDPAAPPKPRQKRKSKFDPYYDEIREKFQYNSPTVKAVYMFFKGKYQEAGIFNSYNSFKAYVRANKLTESAEAARKAHLRYETAPGEEVQLDWKENYTMTLKDGSTISFNILFAVYGYSRYVHMVYSRTKTTEDFLRCLTEVMKNAGGKPKYFKTDNMSAIVKVKNNRKNKLPIIRQFEKDIETPIRLCKVRNPRSKGKVESAVRFASWLDAYQNELESEEDVIRQITRINQEINREPSRTTGVMRAVLMTKEKEYLRPLGNLPLLDSYLKNADTQIVPDTLLVDYRGHGYSVPKKLIGKRVKLTADENILHIYYNAKLVASHEIAAQPLNYKTDHYIESLKEAVSRKADQSQEDYEDMITKKARESLERMKELKGKVK